MPKCAQNLTALGRVLATGNFREGASATAKNAELGFVAPFLCWRLSERVGFGERGMVLCKSSRSELEVPKKQYSQKCAF